MLLVNVNVPVKLSTRRHHNSKRGISHKKRLTIRIFSFFCAVMLLFLSPCAKYIDASSVENAYATGLEIPVALGAEAAIELLIAFLASVAVEETYTHREAIAQAYGNYLEEKAAEMPTEGAYLQYYDVSTGSIEYVMLDALCEDLKNYHDETVDNLTGVYAKYCPALLGTFDDFMADVLSREVYVRGISENLVDFAPLAEADIEEQCSGVPFTYRWRTYCSSDYCNYSGEICPFIDDISYSETSTYPMVGYFLKDASRIVTFDFGLTVTEYSKDFRISARSSRGYKDIPPGYATLTRTVYGIISQCNVVTWVSNALWYSQKVIPGRFNGSFSATANFPIFRDEESASKYLLTGEGYENALNYMPSMYDRITDNVDLPPFYRQWQEELWERVAKTPDHGIGIGKYGRGVSSDNWSDDIPWIGLDSLSRYGQSLPDIYQKVIDDIINGTYDANEDIPETYSDAWEHTISDSWDDTVETPDEVGDEGKSEDEEKDGDKEKENENKPLPDTQKKLDEMSPQEIINLSLEQLIELLPDGWEYSQSPDGRFIHFRDENGTFRIRIDPPDDGSPYTHIHIFDEYGNALDINGNIVPHKSPDAHIPRP